MEQVMRPPTRRNPEHDRKDRRERIRRQRLAAPPMRTAYPRLSLLNLRFSFVDGSERPPVAQTHILHPPAAAFFHFACGFADCDGGFNLGSAIAELSGAGTREAVRQFECTGLRTRDKASGQPCGLKLECSISMQYAREMAA